MRYDPVWVVRRQRVNGWPWAAMACSENEAGRTIQKILVRGLRTCICFRFRWWLIVGDEMGSSVEAWFEYLLSD